MSLRVGIHAGNIEIKKEDAYEIFEHKGLYV
jgi:hypothetical protein